MSIITININNKNFRLSCAEGVENDIHNLASELDKRVIECKNISHNASFELLLVLVCLSLQDELSNAKSMLSKIDNDKFQNDEEEKLSETLMTIAGYLENIAKKIV